MTAITPRARWPLSMLSVRTTRVRTRRAVKLQHPFLARAGRSCRQELFDGLGRDGVAVTTADQGDGLAVAEHGVTALVCDENGLGEGVERPAQPDRLRARLRHRFGGPVSGPFHVDEDVLEVLGLLVRRVGAEPGSEGLQPLSQTARAAPGRYEARRDNEGDHDHDCDHQLENRQAKDRAHCHKHGMADRPRAQASFPPRFPPRGRYGGSRCGQPSNAKRQQRRGQLAEYSAKRTPPPEKVGR